MFLPFALLLACVLHSSIAVQTTVQINTLSEFPPNGQLLPNTTYNVRTELDLRNSTALSLTGAAEGGSLLDCRSGCFSVGDNASLSLSAVGFVARPFFGSGSLIRTAGPSAGWSANECKIRIANLPVSSTSTSALYAPDFVALTAGVSVDVELDGIGSAAGLFAVRSLVAQSVNSGNLFSFARVRLSRVFVDCVFGAGCLALNNASLSVAQSTFSYTYNSEQSPAQVVLQVPANNGATDVAVSLVDSTFSQMQLLFSGVRRIDVNGTNLSASTMSATLKPSGLLSVLNCNASFGPFYGNSLIRIDGPSSALKITGINVTGSSVIHENYDIVEVAVSAVNSSVTISDVRAIRIGNILAYNARLPSSSQSATLTGLRLVNAAIVSGRCPQALTVRHVEAINATDRTLIDIDISFTTTIDVRDMTTDRCGGTIVRLSSGLFSGNLTMRNITVTASPTLRAILQVSGSATNSQMTLSDIAVVGGRVVSTLFNQQSAGSVALSRWSVRGITASAILLRTINGTIDGFDVANVTLNAAAVMFSGGGSVLRNFKATDCTISSSSSVVQYNNLGQNSPWQMSNALFRNVTTSNGALIEFDTRNSRLDANTTASITDVTIQNCTSRVGIRWSTFAFGPMTMVGWHLTLERLNAVDFVGGMIEFNYAYGSGIVPQYQWGDSLRLNSVRADRVTGNVARVALLSDVIVTDLRATNCDFICDPQGSRALFVTSARTVQLSNVVLADNRGCNITLTPNDASVWLQFVGSAVNITDCAFERLMGGTLGSMAIVDTPQASLTRARFDGNRGASALMTQTTQSSAMVLSVNDGFFRNNSAGSGAAIRATNTHLLVRGSRFYDNAALNDGGAIHVTCCESKLVVGESLFRGNRAGTTGAAVYSLTSSASLSQVDIVENVVADGRANATGAVVHMRGLSASASVDLSRLTVARNVAGANASVVDVSGAKTVVATDMCSCSNSANGSAEAAAIVCRNSPATFVSLSNVVAAATAGCMADNAVLQPCTATGCALRVPMLQADPPTPAPPTPPPVTLPPTQQTPSPLPGGDATTTAFAAGNNSTTSSLDGSNGAISDGEADIGLIVGAAVGGCVGLLLLIALIVFCVARRRRRGQNGDASSSAAQRGTEMVTARDEGNGHGGSIGSYGGGSIGAPSSSQYGSTFLSTPSSAASASGGNQHYRDMDMQQQQQQQQEARQSTYGDLTLNTNSGYESPAAAAAAQRAQVQVGVYNNW